MIGLFACSTDELDFVPPANPQATYNFSISQGNSSRQYSLVEVTQFASQSGNVDSWEYFAFLLKGKDRESGAEVHITGQTFSQEINLNIAVTERGSTTFYKDCNSFNGNIYTGEDATGKFVQLKDFYSGCLTTTLDSERRIDITTFNANLSPMTFYISEE